MELAVAPGERETVYAGTSRGLPRREPDGSWTLLTDWFDGVVVAVAGSPAQPERVAIGDQAENDVRSDDGGMNWVSE